MHIAIKSRMTRPCNSFDSFRGVGPGGPPKVAPPQNTWDVGGAIASICDWLKPGICQAWARMFWGGLPSAAYPKKLPVA